MIERSPIYGKKDAPKQIVILLHGLGSNGQDLIGLAPHMAEQFPDALFISPDAPFACDMVPEGYPDSYQWFSLQDRTPDAMQKGAEMAHPILENFITNTLKQHNVSANNCALVGFSQGSMMAMYTAPRYKEKLAGVLAFSGAYLQGDISQYNHKPPVYLIHGEQDDVVPVTAYHMAREGLEKNGFNVSGHTSARLTHSIDEDGLKKGTAFLNTVLS